MLCTGRHGFNHKVFAWCLGLDVLYCIYKSNSNSSTPITWTDRNEWGTQYKTALNIVVKIICSSKILTSNHGRRGNHVLFILYSFSSDVEFAIHLVSNPETVNLFTNKSAIQSLQPPPPHPTLFFFWLTIIPNRNHCQ